MNLHEYKQIILDSAPEHWNMITCWGYSSGPSFLEKHSVSYSSSDEQSLEVVSHGMRATLKTDLAIWIAWGITSNPDFKEPWANEFSDPSASSGFVDFFYNNVLVYRDIYVYVDGNRCRLPLPERELDLETGKVERYTVSRERYEFFQMFDGFEQVSDFQTYFQSAKLVTVDKPWMT